MNCRALPLSASTSCQRPTVVRFTSHCSCTIITTTLSNIPSRIDLGRGRLSHGGCSRRKGPSTAGGTASATARLIHNDLLSCQRSVDMTLRSVCSSKSDDSQSTSSVHESSGCMLTARLSDHQRPTDGQTLTAVVTSKRRRDSSSTITRI